VIIKGKAVGSVKHWSRYLPEAGENEKVTEHEIRGTVKRDLKGALEEMRDIASATRSEGNFLYHASFNPKASENLTPEQWQKAIDLVEKKMGFEGHQRIVYEHVKEGRQHFHVLWNRVDPNTMTIKDIKGDRYTLRRAANQLEKEFGLQPTKAVRDYDDVRPFDEWELKQAKRSKIELKEFKSELTALWHATDSGKAFIAAVEERGYAIAKGDRRDFVILDRTGEVHSLARRLDGVNVADVRARFQDVDRDSLPGVTEARGAQSERAMDVGGTFDRDAAERAWDETLGKSAIAHGKKLDDAERRAAWIAEKRSAAPFTKIEERINNTLERTIERPWQFADELKEDRIVLARATAADIENLAKDRAVNFAAEDEPQLASLPPVLKEGELVAIGSTGRVHRLNEHKLDLDEIAGRYSTGTAAPLQSVTGARETQIASRTEPQERSWRSNEVQDGPQMGGPFRDSDDGMLSVVDMATNVVMGVGEFLIGFFDSSPPPQPMSREERSLAERKSERALDNMKRSCDQGEPFKDHDITALTQQHLLQIRVQGDPYLRDLLAQRDRERQRYIGNERER